MPAPRPKYSQLSAVFTGLKFASLVGDQARSGAVTCADPRSVNKPMARDKTAGPTRSAESIDRRNAAPSPALGNG